MKLFAALLLATAVAAVLAGSAAQASSTRGPTSLWYKIELLVKDTVETTDGSLESKSLWHFESNVATTVTIHCVSARAMKAGSCADAYQGRPRPRGAFNDLSFTAGGVVWWDSYKETYRTPETEIWDGGPGHCSERTVTTSVTPGHFTGIVGSGSLAREGFRIGVGPPRSGFMRVDDSGQTCSSPAKGDYVNIKSVSGESAMKEFPAMYTPVTPTAIELARRPVQLTLGGVFGHSFNVSGSYTSPTSTGGKTWKSELKLIFTVCPNGGRNVRTC